MCLYILQQGTFEGEVNSIQYQRQISILKFKTLYLNLLLVKPISSYLNEALEYVLLREPKLRSQHMLGWENLLEIIVFLFFWWLLPWVNF